jgi:hypothetical protein
LAFVQETVEALQDKLTPYPMMVITADSWDNIHLPEQRQILVYFERQPICSCSTVLAAVSAVFMLYYVFDVQFPSVLSNTMKFFDIYLCKLSTSKLPAVVQRKLNVLLAGQ